MLVKDLENFSLSVKYRPSTLDEVVGNETVVKSLKTILARKEGLPHSFLFTGPSGCGKTTMALILAKALGCDPQEFRYFDTSNTRGIDTIRDIKTKSQFRPLQGNIKFYLLDECHKLTNEAQNAMLSLLEHPPSHAYFALCTTEPNKLLDTIRNRCHTFQVKSLLRHQIAKLVKSVLEREEVEMGDEVIKSISSKCAGSPRAALRMLDQIIDIPEDDEALKAVEEYTVDEVTIIDICKLLLEPGGDKWTRMAPIIKGLLEEDQEPIRIGIINYMTKVLLNSNGEKGNYVAKLLHIFCDTTFNTGKMGKLTVQLYAACKL